MVVPFQFYFLCLKSFLNFILFIYFSWTYGHVTIFDWFDVYFYYFMDGGSIFVS